MLRLFVFYEDPRSLFLGEGLEDLDGMEGGVWKFGWKGYVCGGGLGWLEKRGGGKER